MWVASFNPSKAWIEYKRGGKLDSFSFWLFSQASIFFCSPHSWFSGLQAQTGLYQLKVLRVQNCGIGFPGSLVCTEQVLKLLNLGNCMSQYHMLNLFIYKLYICTYRWCIYKNIYSLCIYTYISTSLSIYIFIDVSYFQKNFEYKYECVYVCVECWIFSPNGSCPLWISESYLIWK